MRIEDLATKLEKLQLEVEEARVALGEAEKRLVECSEREIPEAMDELGLRTVQTSDGLVVKVVETVNAAISRDREKLAFDWLDQNGYGSLVKTQVLARFGRGEDRGAEEAEEALRAITDDVERKKSVHAMTLKKFVKDALAEGVDFPLDLFGVFTRRQAKVERLAEKMEK